MMDETYNVLNQTLRLFVKSLALGPLSSSTLVPVDDKCYFCFSLRIGFDIVDSFSFIIVQE